MPRPKTVTAIVYSARNINSRRGKENPQASVVFGFGKDKYQTSQFRDRNPTWNAEHSFNITDPKLPLKFIIKDKDEPIGQCQIPLAELPCDEHTAKWIPIGPHRKFPNPSGELCVDCWIDEYFDDNCQLKKTNYSRIKQKLGTVSFYKTAKEKQVQDSVGVGGQSLRGSLSIEDLTFEKNEANGIKNGSLFPIQENKKNSSDSLAIPTAKSMMDLSHKRKNSLTETISGESTSPVIKIIVPTMGSEHGGTLVMITGKNLGQSREDIIGLSIAGCDCMSTLEYYSASKVMCTTREGAGSGYISITTLSGGTGVSNIKFHFNSVLDCNESDDVLPSQSEHDKVKKFIQRRKSLSDYHLTKELTQLKGQVFDLKTENKELRQYIDRLLVYLMDQYPEALESSRLYR